MQLMDLLTLISAGVSGIIAGALAIGYMRGQLHALQNELEDFKRRTDREILEQRHRVDGLYTARTNHFQKNGNGG